MGINSSWRVIFVNKLLKFRSISKEIESIRKRIFPILNEIRKNRRQKINFQNLKKKTEFIIF